MVIEAWGYEVMTASAEDEAIEALVHEGRPPDLILADYRLRAGRTGAEAVHHIRQLFGRAIPSVIITGDTAPERIREVKAHGLEITHKPVQPAALKAVIADVVKAL